MGVEVFQERLSEFVTFWVAIDPIGSVPVFLALTGGLTSADKRAVASHAVGIGLMVLLFFIIGGQIMLQAMGVSLAAFQVAGGLVLFLFAVTMIFGPSKLEEDLPLAGQKISQLAVFPLAMPAIASPGAIVAVVLLTDDARHDILDQLMTTAVLVLVLICQYILLRIAGPIQHLIGMAGASVISRVMGLILASVAVTNFMTAISAWLDLPPL